MTVWLRKTKLNDFSQVWSSDLDFGELERKRKQIARTSEHLEGMAKQLAGIAANRQAWWTEDTKFIVGFKEDEHGLLMQREYREYENRETQTLAAANQLFSKWKDVKLDNLHSLVEEQFVTAWCEHSPALEGLSFAQVVEVLEYETSSDVQDAEDGVATFADDAHFAAWARRECEQPCNCQGGYRVREFEFGQKTVKLIMDDEEIIHSACFLRAQLPIAAAINSRLPNRFSFSTLQTLKPWDRSPVPVAAQELTLSGIPGKLPASLQGWLLVGPPGTSKTTITTAAVRDWLTHRWLEKRGCRTSACNGDGDDLHVHIVQVPDWLDEIQAWEYRDFGDHDVRKPSLTPKMITDAASRSGVRPILLLEEIDKFTPTNNRRLMLFRLVDAVYRANGVIVTTANTPFPELKEMVGEPVYRRLAGDNDAVEAYMRWDIFKALSKPKKKFTGSPSPSNPPKKGISPQQEPKDQFPIFTEPDDLPEPEDDAFEERFDDDGSRDEADDESDWHREDDPEGLYR